MNPESVVLIGYSGHAYVVCDILHLQHIKIIGYYEQQEKENNPYQLNFLGSEKDAWQLIESSNYFTAIGDNKIRHTINTTVNLNTNKTPINAIHPSASISPTAQLDYGIMVGDGCVINACSKIGEGVICNTKSIIEHECQIGAYSHIAPGAVLCGNVSVGNNSFIGAGAVVRQGITIGNNVVIGAGTVVVKDIQDSVTVIGNPQRKI